MDWTRAEIAALFDLPCSTCSGRRSRSTARHHAPNEVQLSTLLSIKTGGCPEDCGYCSAVRACRRPGSRPTKLMDVDAVLPPRREAKAAGSGRFCMGAAWREPKDRDMRRARARWSRACKALGLETCMTLGMLTPKPGRPARRGRASIITTTISTPRPNIMARSSPRARFEDRLDTLEHVRALGHGGLLRRHRRHGREPRGPGRLPPRARHPPAHPESVPINALVPVKGTVLGDMLADTPLAKIDDIEFVRTVAVARIAMPRAMVRLSAGRESMSEVDAGALLPRRRQFDLHRRQAAHHRQCRRRRGRGAVRQARPRRDDQRRASARWPPNDARPATRARCAALAAQPG